MKIIHYTEVPKNYSIWSGSQENPLIELEPCPFCGGRAFLNASDSEVYGHCPNCGTDGPRDRQHENVAINKWNKRAQYSSLHHKNTFILRELNNKGITLESVADRLGLQDSNELKNPYRLWNDNDYSVIFDLLDMSEEEFWSKLAFIENNALEINMSW